MIHLRSKGDFKKADKYFRNLIKASRVEILEKYGNKGVAALSSATPVESGLTASSWSYRIERSGSRVAIYFTNSNINKGVNIAIILQYGHGTGTGGWVEGRDYINPAIQPIFDELAEAAWREVTKL